MNRQKLTASQTSLRKETEFGSKGAYICKNFLQKWDKKLNDETASQIFRSF